MFASVRIIVKEYNQVPVIKRDAIVREDSGSYVFLIEDNKAHKRKIQLGLNQADMIEVTSGLTGGETIVITGQQGLKNGMSVEVIEKERLR
jgi:multidrug efflux pump subunit AcrA (membrane-fusion protein)